MNGPWRIALLLTVASIATARTASAAADEGLAHCAAIAAPDARLACYDALAGRSADRPASGIAGAAPVAAPVTETAAASAPAAKPAAASAPVQPTLPAAAPPPATAPVVAATAAAAASSTPPPAQDPRKFGYSAAQQESPAQKAQVLQSIEAHVAQVPTDQLRTTYVVLDNGQTWACTDGDMNLSVGEAVTIKRAALGSFVLTAASKHSYHVRRLR